MDDGSRSTWLIVFLLLLAAMLFAVMETAFASVSRVRLKTGAEKGDKRAVRALYVTEHFDRAITTLLICTNIVHLATASIVTVYVTKRWGVSAVSISTLITTLVVFFFGEMLPKSIARKYSALQFGDVTVESILTSRVDVAAIDINMPQEEILAFIKEQNHSRLPVYEGTIDNIIGILHIRRYIRHYIRRGEALDIRPLLYEPCFIHQSTKIDDLLEMMSRQKINIAVVTDNYGGTLGIVTDEDILEELVGEIWDEDDRAVRNVVPMTDGSYSVNPEEHVQDVLDELGIPYTEEQEEEIGRKLMNELAYEVFPHIPVAGDSFKYLGTQISVLVMRHNRIIRLKVRRLSEEELQNDRDAAEMAGIDPETGRFISDDRTSDRGGEGKNGEGKENISDSSAVSQNQGSAFTEEDARAFAEGRAYQIHQVQGKHYSRSVTKTVERRGGDER